MSTTDRVFPVNDSPHSRRHDGHRFRWLARRSRAGGEQSVTRERHPCQDLGGASGSSRIEAGHWLALLVVAGFEPDATTFLNRESARKAFSELAAFLAANPKATVTLTGNIAHHRSTSRLDYRRAAAVKDLLVELGVAGSRITPVGDGWGPYPTKEAGPDPAYDQQNRRVVVTVSCG
jgi:outer membrane protein OmpA-like peptidoglycan-associated protein